MAAKATRRTFTAEYKQRILQEADRCQQRGELGALLRREGLYSSLLTVWRQALRASPSGTRRRGPSPAPTDPKDLRIAHLERELAATRQELDRSKAVLDIQKKLSALLGLAPTTSGGGN